MGPMRPHFILLFFIVFTLTGCQSCHRIKQGQKQATITPVPTYASRSCTAKDLNGAFLMVRRDSYSTEYFEYLGDPYQLIIFGKNGSYNQMSSTSPIVYPEYGIMTKAKVVSSYKLRDSSRVYVHNSLTKKSYHFDCGVLTKNYPDPVMKRHQDFRTGDLIFKFPCKFQDVCMIQVFRTLKPAELQKSYLHHRSN